MHYAESNRGESPLVLMALCSSGASLRTVADWLSSRPEVCSILDGTAPSLDRLLQLNRRYFSATSRSDEACTKALLLPTLLSLESLYDACHRRPVREEEPVPAAAAVQEEAELEEDEEEEAVVAPPSPEPTGEPEFTKRASVQRLNCVLKRMLLDRKRHLCHKARWCCQMRLDVPYFAARQHEERLTLYLQHGTSEMSAQCGLCDGMHGDATVSVVDEALLFSGALLREAHRIAKEELSRGR